MNYFRRGEYCESPRKIQMYTLPKLPKITVRACNMLREVYTFFNEDGGKNMQNFM